MDFRLTKEEALFQKMCREFALNEVEPLAAEIDEQERMPIGPKRRATADTLLWSMSTSIILFAGNMSRI